MEMEARHQCLIYDGAPSRQLPALAAMIQRKLNEGYKNLYLNSPPMIAGLRSSLAAFGVDVEKEVAEGSIVLSSESAATEDGEFDVDLMLQGLESALDQALQEGYKGLWATGDMTWEFGSEKNFLKLMEYEHRLEDLFHKRQELNGVCQYHKDTLPWGIPQQGLLTHRLIFINEALSRKNPCYVQSGDHTKMPSDLELDEMITALCKS